MPPSGSIDLSKIDLGRKDVRPPDRIGHFAIHGVLGRGGMGVVLDASTPEGERVALKLIRPQGDPGRTKLLVARFQREAQILRRLDHPSIVRLVDAGDTDGVLYLAMERIEGVSLLAIRRRGPLAFDALIALGVRLADALAHMHDSGVVHRDIKPANVLVDIHGRPVITDFGVSASDDAAGITRQGDLLGSPGFMAPEVTEGHSPTPLSDQYALGRLLFELGATGSAKKISKNAPILEILATSLEIEWPRFPKGEPWPGLERIVRRMVAHEAQDRYPTAHDVRDALRALGKPKSARRAPGKAGDVEDLDTLSEHLGKLKLPPTNPWAADANSSTGDLGPMPEPEPPRPVVTTPSRTSKPAALTPDDLLSDLDRPAGEQRRSTADDEKTLETPLSAIEAALAGAAKKAGAAAAANASAQAAARREQDAANGIVRVPVPARTSESPEKTDPAALAPPASELRETVPEEHLSLPPFPAEKGLKLALPGSLRGASAANVEGKPVSPPLAAAAPVVAPASYTSPLALSRETNQARELSARFEPDPTLMPDTPADPTPVAESEAIKLARQVAALKEQLADARRAPAAPRKPGKGMAAGALAVGLAAGGIGGFLLPHAPQAVPVIVATPPKLDEVAGPKFSYKPGEGQKTPSPSDLSDAAQMLKTAEEHLSRRELESAERLLGLCIEISDLPDCHKRLATILALVHDPAARTHLEHYLRVAPAAPDAQAIRQALDQR